MAQVEEENILIAERVPPGDNWVLVDNKKEVIEGLVMTLTAYMRKNKFKGGYRLEPLDGKLYAIKSFEVPEEEPMKYDLYGEY